MAIIIISVKFQLDFSIGLSIYHFVNYTVGALSQSCFMYFFFNIYIYKKKKNLPSGSKARDHAISQTPGSPHDTIPPSSTSLRDLISILKKLKHNLDHTN